MAIKVPHDHLISSLNNAGAHRSMFASGIANLDHPNIVPVFDVGSSDEFPVYVVSKYIDGTSLAVRLRQGPLRFDETIELVASVAEALHYAHKQDAHKQGLVHRDVKPGNILLDRNGKPFVADFGLALRDKDVGKGPCFAGTATYMSPEQARGEGHRVDGRSDIFSLGIVLYEMLTGRRPFVAESQEDIFEQIIHLEPRSPRQVNDQIPKELERICLKAIAKRVSEALLHRPGHGRKSLRCYSSENPSVGRVNIQVIGQPTVSVQVEMPATSEPPNPVPPSSVHAVKIVPKGLRSFGSEDADFFLELVPGPRDREGLPDSIRFWKNRIDASDPEVAFSVALLYGPSGCGKSSLVKAGLLPKLGPNVTVVYVEAAGTGTEARLFKSLIRQLPSLAGNKGLVEALADLRRGVILPAGHKVLFVLDQFEQWLHANKREDSELARALRHCDGGKQQALVMVRDDFWMAATRFMAVLEINLVQGHNCAAVDLFDLMHARKVLASYGRAFGRLPESSSQYSKEQAAFLDQAVAGLAESGKVISARLALLAEMVKGKEWTPATLKEFGGVSGVGVAFLEETFASRSAPPHCRLHQKAAQSVLRVLLPEATTDIKGNRRSHAELLAASGYADRPRDFDDLMRILDSEIRLLTPTELEGESEQYQPSGVSPPNPPERYYQLTHDYLVPLLRDWLTRKQKETLRGRAEVLLEDRAAVWNARPENRQLPSLLQWLQIRWWTQKRSWTSAQRKMMGKARRFHGIRLIVAVLLVTAGIIWAVHQYKQRELFTNLLVNRLMEAEIEEVPAVLSQIEMYRSSVDPILVGIRHASSSSAKAKLRASLALAASNADQVDYLVTRLFDAEPQEVPVIVNALNQYKDKVVNKLWPITEKPNVDKERLAAAAALAAFEPGSSRWDKASAGVTADLVSVNSLHLPLWKQALLPIKGHLLPSLVKVFRDHDPDHAVQSLQATHLLVAFAADQPDILLDLLLDADARQFAEVFPMLSHYKDQALKTLSACVAIPLDSKTTNVDKEILAKKKANAAVALMRLDWDEKIWTLLADPTPPWKEIPGFSDPRVRSYVIHRFAPMGIDPRTIFKRCEEMEDVSIIRALLLGLGEYDLSRLDDADHEPAAPKILRLYEDHPDPGIHSAAEWLLRKWKQDKSLVETNERWTEDKTARNKKLALIQEGFNKTGAKAQAGWYLTGQGQTMVAIPPSRMLVLGSPASEEGRTLEPKGIEFQQQMLINRSFALAAKEVTVTEYRRFRPDWKLRQYTSSDQCPVNDLTWYDAAAYCNWLSSQEDIPESEWCYQVDEQATDESRVKIKPNYLQLTGYRLPTEAEWEFACRAGAETSRFFGETDELLDHYAWYTKNSGDKKLLPVGRLKPNDLGFFDMLGNVSEWCHERLFLRQLDGKVRKERLDHDPVNNKEGRAIRGGAFGSASVALRSAYRFWLPPTSKNAELGFRPARTLKID